MSEFHAARGAFWTIVSGVFLAASLSFAMNGDWIGAATTALGVLLTGAAVVIEWNKGVTNAG